MRRLLFCVPMIILLSACSGTAEISQAEQLALVIRGEYLEAESCLTQVSLTADYGQRVYQYELEASVTPEETTLTLTAPETVSGVVAHLQDGESALEYDGMWVDTGPLDDQGLTPVSAVPALLEAARGGYITACSTVEEGNQPLLRVDCGDPEGTPGQGTEISLWFSCDSHALVRGEIRSDGFRTVSCTFVSFTMS